LLADRHLVPAGAKTCQRDQDGSEASPK